MIESKHSVHYYVASKWDGWYPMQQYLWLCYTLSWINWLLNNTFQQKSVRLVTHLVAVSSCTTLWVWLGLKIYPNQLLLIAACTRIHNWEFLFPKWSEYGRMVEIQPATKLRIRKMSNRSFQSLVLSWKMELKQK